MFIEYNKFTILLYFITGVTLTLSAKRYIYGLIVVLFSGSILLQRQFLNEPYLYKYNQISNILPVTLFLLVVYASLLVIYKSSQDINKKLFTSFFLLFFVMYNIVKKMYSNTEIMKSQISRYIPIYYLWYLYGHRDILKITKKY